MATELLLESNSENTQLVAIGFFFFMKYKTKYFHAKHNDLLKLY